MCFFHLWKIGWRLSFSHPFERSLKQNIQTQPTNSPSDASLKDYFLQFVGKDRPRDFSPHVLEVCTRHLGDELDWVARGLAKPEVIIYF